MMYWWDRFARQPRVRLRYLEESVYEDCSTTAFEIENIGGTTTSCEPMISMTALNVKKRRMHRVLTIRETDRTLQPHVPKRFRAWDNDPEREIGFSWFRKYSVGLTRGWRAVQYIRNDYGMPLSRIRFHLERLRFLTTGAVTPTDREIVPGPADD